MKIFFQVWKPFLIISMVTTSNSGYSNTRNGIMNKSWTIRNLCHSDGEAPHISFLNQFCLFCFLFRFDRKKTNKNGTTDTICFIMASNKMKPGRSISPLAFTTLSSEVSLGYIHIHTNKNRLLNTNKIRGANNNKGISILQSGSTFTLSSPLYVFIYVSTITV